MSQVGVGNLIEIQSRSHALAVAQVGAGATTTSVPLDGINLSTSDLAGGWALFDEGAFGQGSPPTLAPIASNSATSLSFASGVLSTAPTQGYNVWLFQAGTFNVTVNAPENIAAVGGQSVPTANGIPSVPVVGEGDIAEGTPGAAPPAQAMQVAGSDGTYLRALRTDTDGTAQNNVTKLAGLAIPTDFSGNVRLPVTEYNQQVFDGTIGATQTGFLASGDEAAYLNLTVDGTYRVNGALYLESLTVNLGGKVILGPTGQIVVGSF